MSQDQLSVSPIFTGLTRPPMFLGVTLDYIGVSFIIALCVVMLLDNPLYIVLYLPLHIMGWFACKIDHNIFRLLMKRADCAYQPNKRLWGCNSYEPF